jgi:hypothetical protein
MPYQDPEIDTYPERRPVIGEEDQKREEEIMELDAGGRLTEIDTGGRLGRELPGRTINAALPSPT